RTVLIYADIIPMFSRLLFPNQRDFASLDGREILSLAISAEEEDGRIYAEMAAQLRDRYPATAAVLDGMAEEEGTHRGRLLALYRIRYGDHLVPIRRDDVRGFLRRRPIWLARQLSLEAARQLVFEMEESAGRFYTEAAKSTTDAEVRKLLGDLALAESRHREAALRLEAEHLGSDARGKEKDVAHREFVLTYVQPGLAGLMDGSVSTLAPVFAAAFATGNTWETFLVGLAASVGAGISMGFTEAAADDGRL